MPSESDTSQTKGLKDAVREIIQALSPQPSANLGSGESQATQDRPFFFVIGAGLSFPPVPLVDDMVESFRLRVMESRPGTDPLPTGLDKYSQAFQVAYPQGRDRQKYLEELVKGRAIPAGALRLAHLLINGLPAKMVVTTNFDDFLIRALRLFGADAVVCDHPGTVDRIDPDSHDTIQLIHIHGTYQFYDCCNLGWEIEERATGTEPYSHMADIIDQVLHRHSPLVLGYSGRETDAFMKSLEKRLTTRLGVNVYWFCHTLEAMDVLPEWLRSHPQVFFVIPEASVDSGSDTSLSSPITPSSVGAMAQSHPVASGPTTGAAGQVMSAISVLDALITGFHLQAPDFTTDPIGTFRERVRRDIGSGTSDFGEDDIYQLGDVIKRINTAYACERESKQAEEGREQSLRILAEIQDLLRRSDYGAALRQARSLTLPELEAHSLRSLLGLLSAVRPNVMNMPEDLLSVSELIVDVIDLLTETGAQDPAFRPQVAESLYDKGVALGQSGQHQKALAAYDEVVDRFGDALDPGLRHQVAKAMVNRGVTLWILNKPEEAMAACDEVVDLLGDASESDLRSQVAMALSNKGLILGNRGEHRKAVAVFDEVLRRLSDPSESELPSQVATALYNKGVALAQLGEYTDAVIVFDKVVSRFEESVDPALRLLVVQSLYNKGVALGQSGHHLEAAASCDEVASHVGDASDPVLRLLLAQSLYNKGVALGQAGEQDAAISAYDEVVRRFEKDGDQALRLQVAQSLVNKGVVMDQAGEQEAAISAYDEVVRRFEKDGDQALRLQVARSLYNKGIAFGQAGKQEAAISAYDEVVRRFEKDGDPVMRDVVRIAKDQRDGTGAPPLIPQE